MNPGIDLICVIDRSGSMNGTKIDYVKEALFKLLDFLHPNDRLSLIIFNE
jgi:Mg-chelatase subunit ChlD